MLLELGPGVFAEPVRLAKGDMLQITPFTYPLTRSLHEGTLSVAVDGDNVFESVGQIALAQEVEGRAGLSLFLLAQQPGKAILTVQLIDSYGNPRADYRTTYTVEVR